MIAGADMASPAHRLRLTLVRHGETAGQSSIRYYGRTDVPLSTAGREQMRRVSAALAGRRFAAAYTSTLARSTEGARIVTSGIPLIKVAAFDEIDFGEWEGLTAAEIQLRHSELFAQWGLRRGDFHYPGGESNRDFRARVAAALHQLLAQSLADELLFVLHKGVMRSILAELLGDDEVQRCRLAIELGSIHVVVRENGRWIAEYLDETAHLSLLA